MSLQRRRYACWLLFLALAGCGRPEDEDLHAWMDKVRREAAPAPSPEPEPLVIRPVTYEPAERADPFGIGKITLLAGTSSGGGARPDPHRVCEPLESYPLDSLRMVGSLLQRGQVVALIQADKVLYQVRNGQHLGQDQGKVIRISDAAVEIEEVVQEATGNWATRTVQLSIQGGK